jgi:hypothetical protein
VARSDPDAAARRRAAAEILAEETISADTAEETGGLVVFLSEGDAIVAKISEETRIGNRDVWLTYGVTTVVRPEEIEGLAVDDEDEVTEVYDYARSRAISAVLDGLDDLRSAYHNNLAARAAARSRRSDQQ